MGNYISDMIGEYNGPPHPIRRRRGPKRKLNREPKVKRRVKPLRKKANNFSSAYALFISEVRNQMKNRKMIFRGFTASCAQKWRQMSAQEKQKYYSLADEKRKQMLRECGKARRGPKKDGTQRQLSPYWKFARLYRPYIYRRMSTNIRLRPRMQDVNREIGFQWRQLTPEERNRYRD
jgi:hypothetical protein